MKHCQFCKATFASEDAYQIHLGIGAPAFHDCNDANEMLQKGMTQSPVGEWDIAENRIIHQNGWAYLKEAEYRSGECAICERWVSMLSSTGVCEGCILQAQIDAMEESER